MMTPEHLVFFDTSIDWASEYAAIRRLCWFLARYGRQQVSEIMHWPVPMLLEAARDLGDVIKDHEGKSGSSFEDH